MQREILDDLKNEKETVWINDGLLSLPPRFKYKGYGFVHLKAAQARLLRFMPYLEITFPETAPRKGLIEANLLPVSEPLKEDLCRAAGLADAGLIPGRVLIKDDAHLPIAGSVKARGGIHEALMHAEQLAMKAGMLRPTDNYSILAEDRFGEFFSRYTIQVGSTGNLGLSIGIMGAALGFHVIVHMSRDAVQWKKDLLREKGVDVREYAGDYSAAVAEGRRLSQADPDSYFVDDENSEALFFGYSAAALRTKIQLMKQNVVVDREHPLFVYLPCGVGGAPGGITYGFRQVFGDDVHCFFAEPVGAPCFTLGMASGKGSGISVGDLGLSGRTAADGLAVGRPSPLVCSLMEGLVSGSFTVEDARLYAYEKAVYAREKLFLEPSACAGFHGLTMLQQSEAFQDYIRQKELKEHMQQASHIVWATGGGLVPQEEQRRCLDAVI